MNLKNKTLLLACLATLLLTPLTSLAADYVPKIICGVVKADSWTMDNNKESIYQLEAKAGGQLTALKEGRDVYLAPLGGAVYQDGMMYGIHFKQEYDPYDQAYTYTIYNVAYDMQTWTRTKGQALSNMYGNLISSCGMTHDPVTGKNFGIFYNFNMNYEVINCKLATIDFVDTEASGAPKKEIIGIVDTPFAAIAACDNGFLYGVGKDGWLYIIDKVLEEEATSVMVYPLGDLGIDDISTYPSSMTFDPRTKKLYWNYVTTAGKSRLYEISYAIGSVGATKLMDIPDNAFLVNMYIAPMAAADDAPAAVDGLAANFQNEQTTGTVTFTMPTQTYSGDALSGELTYVVYADGKQVATGTAQAGAQVEKTVSVDSEGKDVELKVTAKNAAGEGAPSTATLYIGRDTPLTVTNLQLSYNIESEYMRLTWEAPTEGTHGKSLTQYNLSYNIVRQPDNVVVAEGTKLLGFNEKIEKTSELKSYYYEVVVVNGTHQSDVAASNKVIVGQALVPPFDENFQTQQGFDRFTVVDANNDGKQWKRMHKFYQYSGTTVDYAQMVASSTVADDDYLLTPPLQLEKGGVYELKFTASKNYSDRKYNQKMRVLVGPAGESPADYTVVKDEFDIDDVNLEEFFTDVNISADGVYQIAFHATSPAGSDALNIDEIHLAASLLATSPQAATDIEATADAQGYLRATVKCTAPSKNLHGDALTVISHIDVINIDGQVLGTLANPTPGAPCTIEAEHLSNGINTYYVVAYSGNAAGAKAPFELFVGQDYPTEPTDVALADNGTEAVLTWKAPAQGLNGLALNPDLLTYNLYEISADGYPTLIKKNITSPYHTGVATTTGDQQLLYYALDAQNTAGASELVATNSLVTGQPYELPYIDGFDGTNQSFVWIEGEYADWNIGRVKISSDDDGYAMAFEPNRADYGFYNLGKIALAGATKPTLSFDYYAMPATDVATLSIAIDADQQGNEVVMKQIDFQKETQTEWKHVDIDLSQFLQKDYIIVKFAMTSLSSAANPTTIVFDNVRIEDTNLTAIQSAATADGDQKTVSRLDGVRLNGTSPLRKGIYIVGGRKVVVK